jgi:hypothetical protein
VTRRAALVLALLAALHGAPPPLLAAPPNQLSSPAASTWADPSRTLFDLSVPAGGRPEARSAAAGGGDGAPRGASRDAVDPLDLGPGTREIGDLLLVLGIVVGVAAAVLLMTGWLLATRTRDDEREPAEAEAKRALRARRGARAPGRDPVLAAMGLDDEASPPDPDD